MTTYTNNTTGLSLSNRYWGLDWSRVLPWSFEEIRLDSVSFEEALPFMKEHYASIFGAQAADGRFLASPMTEAKRRFCDESDVMLFRVGDRTIGMSLSHPTDWSTYYLRSFALLPEFRERRLATRFMEKLCEALRQVEVERIESECSPANTPSMRMLVGQGFLLTSIANSERWGATARFTKFLTEESGAVFLRQFNLMTPQKKLSLNSQSERSRP